MVHLVRFHSSVTLEGTVLKWSAIQRIHWYTDDTYAFQAGLKTGNPVLGTSQKPQRFKQPSEMGISSTCSGLMMNDWYCNILKILKKILNVVQVFEKKRRTFLSDWKWTELRICCDHLWSRKHQQTASRLRQISRIIPESTCWAAWVMLSASSKMITWHRGHWSHGGTGSLQHRKSVAEAPRSYIRIIVEGMRSRVQKCSETRKHLEIVTWWHLRTFWAQTWSSLAQATPTQPKHGIDISRLHQVGPHDLKKGHGVSGRFPWTYPDQSGYPLVVKHDSFVGNTL